MIGTDDYIIWAESVVGNGATETENRSAVSRAYYSLFHACEDFSSRPGVTLIPDPAALGKHDKLYSSFRIASAARIPAGTNLMIVRRIGLMANSVYKPYRVHADYHLDQFKGNHFTEEYATDAVAKIRLLFDQVKGL